MAFSVCDYTFAHPKPADEFTSVTIFCDPCGAAADIIPDSVIDGESVQTGDTVRAPQQAEPEPEVAPAPGANPEPLAPDPEPADDPLAPEPEPEPADADPFG